MNISQAIGSIFSGSLAGKWGRKKAILVSNIFIVIGWALIGLSDGDFSLMMAGRNIQGAFFLASVSQVYLAEVSDAQRRSVAFCRMAKCQNVKSRNVKSRIVY
jgi:MFS family permease